MKLALQLATFIGSAIALTGAWTPAVAAPAADANSVLILDSTVSFGVGSVEAVEAVALGLTVEVVDAATWAGKSAADFGSYRALILGDPTCVAGTGPIAAAEANRATWGPEIDGNVVVIGTDEVFHDSQGGRQLSNSSIAFAADEATKTGLMASLSCYYYDAAPGTPVPLLDVFGAFTVREVGSCYNDAHIVAVHPALAGTSDASLSNWYCSVHEAFDSFPSAGPGAFLPLAIAENVAGEGNLSFADGTNGVPYILARGETLTPIFCGNGILEATEECDDGNVANGDGCSAQCTIEEPTGPVCGNGLVETDETCDDGNLTNGDGCSEKCAIEDEGPVCGNKEVEKDEACDDGNLIDGDGCSAKCTIEQCVVTQSYWKNHPADWPVSSLTLGKTTYTKRQLLRILDKSPSGNGLISLAHQLIGAKLNVAAGAIASPSVAADIAAADALIGNKVIPPIGNGTAKPATTSKLTEALRNFNQGLSGPLYCSDKK